MDQARQSQASKIKTHISVSSPPKCMVPAVVFVSTTGKLVFPINEDFIFQKYYPGNHEVAAQFDSDGDVSEIGRNGSWIWSKFGSGLHDGWLYRKNSESDQITYIYDDSSTVIHGIFHDRTLVEGRASKIVAFRCNNGLYFLVLIK